MLYSSHMTTSYYRIQTADRDVNELLDPTEQQSRAWQNEDIVQDGVSVCDSLESLADYLGAGPGQGIPFGAGEWVIVELAGTLMFTDGHDADYGELLVRPTEIVSVHPMDDEFFEMIGAAFDRAMEE